MQSYNSLILLHLHYPTYLQRKRHYVYLHVFRYYQVNYVQYPKCSKPTQARSLGGRMCYICLRSALAFLLHSAAMRK